MVSSDHCIRRCSRRISGKALEKARRLTTLERLRSGGKGRGDSVGVGKTRDAGETSLRVTSAGSEGGLMNAGHSSNVFRVAISLVLADAHQIRYLEYDIIQGRNFEYFSHNREKSNE